MASSPPRRSRTPEVVSLPGARASAARLGRLKCSWKDCSHKRTQGAQYGQAVINVSYDAEDGPPAGAAGNAA
jgi:hypothetical protein